MAIAKIIVDVPLMQTDQPYSYKVPEEFVEMLEVGMRVHVPFGKGNRLIQGIVLGLESQLDEEVADQDLKEIAEVLDFSPVLTQEQLWLAEELRKSVFSYKISNYSINYRKQVQANDVKTLYRYLAGQGTIKIFTRNLGSKTRPRTRSWCASNSRV